MITIYNTVINVRNLQSHMMLKYILTITLGGHLSTIETNGVSLMTLTNIWIMESDNIK